jgi:SOS-response transcriptional repressor LexA
MSMVFEPLTPSGGAVLKSRMEKISKDLMLRRIAGRLDELGLKENAASVRAGLERSYLSQLRRKPERWPTVDKLTAICDVLGLRVAWVMTGLGRRLTIEPDPTADVAEVPLLSWVAASRFDEASASSADTKKLLVHAPNDGDLIALTVRGDSMDRIAPEGSVIVVDRSDRTLVSKAYYIFSRDNDGEATFKRWQVNPERLEPMSTNSAHEPIFVDSRPQVIGRVRLVMTQL